MIVLPAKIFYFPGPLIEFFITMRCGAAAQGVGFKFQCFNIFTCYGSLNQPGSFFGIFNIKRQ